MIFFHLKKDSLFQSVSHKDFSLYSEFDTDSWEVPHNLGGIQKRAYKGDFHQIVCESRKKSEDTNQVPEEGYEGLPKHY